MAKVTRSNNKLLAGVCGGFAKKFGLNVNATRIAFAIILFTTFFAAAIFYIILWLLCPTESSAQKYKERMQNRLRK